MSLKGNVIKLRKHMNCHLPSHIPKSLKGEDPPPRVLLIGKGVQKPKNG
jgi:hypothetical protein